MNVLLNPRHVFSSRLSSHLQADAGHAAAGTCSADVVRTKSRQGLVSGIGNPNRCQIAKEIVIFELPLLGGSFFYAGSKLDKIPATDLIDEALFVMIRRVQHVQRMPLMSSRIVRSGSVVSF
jgi:hypothetical protein